uniref:Ig-like domain-containing protein n=1 Tax=Lates calcarifer TaxID=8187 RepID=A0A4W6ECY8_LATCA
MNGRGNFLFLLISLSSTYEKIKNKNEILTQPASVTVQPGQRLTITCQVSYSLSSYYTAWIRQPAGKELEWMSDDSSVKDSLKNKFSVDLDSSSKTVTLNGQNMQPEDTAVYYCARHTTTQTICRPEQKPLSPGQSLTITCQVSGYSLTDNIQHSSVSAQNNKYIGVSFIQISKSDWDSRKSYNCTVTHVGAPKILHVQSM